MLSLCHTTKRVLLLVVDFLICNSYTAVATPNASQELAILEKP
jgi:hypothetical protein